MWKKQKTTPFTWSPPSNKVKYPKWTVLKVDDEYFIITGAKTKRKIISQRAALTWSVAPLTSTKEALSGYILAGQAGFRLGTIIKSPITGVYCYIDGTKFFEEKMYPIGTPDFWSILGFNPNLAIEVSVDELDFYKEGEIIKNVNF